MDENLSKCPQKYSRITLSTLRARRNDHITTAHIEIVLKKYNIGHNQRRGVGF